MELSEHDSTNRPLNDPQAIKEKEIKEKEIKLNKTLSSREEGERDVFKNLQTFKQHFIQKNTNVPFYTEGLGYMATTGFIVDEHGYIFNTVSKKSLIKEEAFKIWDFLYNYYKQQAS